ncbi:MAG: glycosyltransferase family 2 protein [Parcubacteria group bacterium]|jgi:GT2 family glycosyltransferase|nr:glycosyltransferase family 2 protein [Candidatus Moranbacteria bacterium]
MNSPELSIIVTSYKNPELLRICLDSIKKNVKDIDYELIVVDSATEEDTEMMMREHFPNDKFFSFKKNVGFQSLVKKGIEESEAKFMLILNGDIIIKENSVEKLLEYIKKNPSVGLVGPKLLSFNGKFQASCFRYYKPITIIYRRTFLGKMWFAKKHLGEFLMEDYDHKDPEGVDWIMGSAMMMPRSAVEKVGYMDPQFFMYMEDVDWCRRFWENGLRVVYVPEAIMLHYHGKGSGKSGLLKSVMFNRLTWIHIVSALKYFKKYLGKPNPRKIFEKTNGE